MTDYRVVEVECMPVGADGLGGIRRTYRIGDMEQTYSTWHEYDASVHVAGAVADMLNVGALGVVSAGYRQGRSRYLVIVDNTDS